MKRFLIILSLILPAGILAYFWLFPEQAIIWQQPLLHFYLVTFFSFSALVVAFFTAVSLGGESTPRHQLMATAFATMGALFFMHGVTTPGAILFTPNPGIRWAAWLTMFVGGVIFALAAFDTPRRPLPLNQRYLINGALALFCAFFIFIVIFVPHWLTAVDERAAPWHEQVVTFLTFGFWLFAAVRLTWTWRQTGNRVDGTMALLAAWFTIGTLSLHGFPVWELSWWVYHIILLLGVITAVMVLVQAYEQLRRFRLTYYYAAVGLILTASMALLASHLFSRLVEQYLVRQIAVSEMVTAVVEARLYALLIAGGAMGLLYLMMLVVVSRADRLITARNDELAQAYANLQAAEAMRDDLTDMIVHDLRSPLTSIKLGLDLMQKSRQDAERFEEMAGRTGASVQQMMQLVDQLLDVARLETGQIQIARQPLQIEALLRQKSALFASQAEAGGKHLTVEIAPDLPGVPADKELISRVLDNLITNALKYTSPQGHILLRAQPNGRDLTVQIVDDGEGIDAAVAARIFDKFYQVKDGSGKPLRRGTGLGLTFCKLVVEAHHGRIWVESSPGQGSTFSFTLPVDQP